MINAEVRQIADKLRNLALAETGDDAEVLPLFQDMLHLAKLIRAGHVTEVSDRAVQAMTAALSELRGEVDPADPNTRRLVITRYRGGFTYAEPRYTLHCESCGQEDKTPQPRDATTLIAYTHAKGPHRNGRPLPLWSDDGR